MKPFIKKKSFNPERKKTVEPEKCEYRGNVTELVQKKFPITRGRAARLAKMAVCEKYRPMKGI